jgi:hypothetical protein
MIGDYYKFHGRSMGFLDIDLAVSASTGPYQVVLGVAVGNPYKIL